AFDDVALRVGGERARYIDQSTGLDGGAERQAQVRPGSDDLFGLREGHDRNGESCERSHVALLVMCGAILYGLTHLWRPDSAGPAAPDANRTHRGDPDQAARLHEAPWRHRRAAPRRRRSGSGAQTVRGTAILGS